MDKPDGLNNSSTYIGLVPAQNLGLVILMNRGNRRMSSVAAFWSHWRALTRTILRPIASAAVRLPYLKFKHVGPDRESDDAPDH